MSEKLLVLTESKLPAVIYPESNQVAVGYDNALKADIRFRLLDIMKDLNELNDSLNKFEDDLKVLRRPQGFLGRIAVLLGLAKSKPTDLDD